MHISFTIDTKLKFRAVYFLPHKQSEVVAS